MPLAFVIARYFAYSFAAVALAWLVAFLALSSAIGAGLVYEASWGPANAREVALELAGTPELGAEDIPTAYRYLIVDGRGAERDTDLTADLLGRARKAAFAARSAKEGDVAIEGGGSGLTFASFPLDGGGACVLVSEYLPQWRDRAWAERLPNPQNLMLVAGIAGSALALALVARRASRVISRKMAPLAEAAERIGREELDFTVGRTNVREMNDVLSAMDAMRAQLASSLEARWRSEQAQRDQVAALAHDLKTPLTVLRANADFVAEELSCADGKTDPDRDELACAARDIACGADRLDGYVRLLIDASRGAASARPSAVEPGELCRQVAVEAEATARAQGIELAVDIDPAVDAASAMTVDRSALARAVANLVANAAEHARTGIGLRCSLDDGALIVRVSDDGAGFSPAALEHGCERFFTEDGARTSKGGSRHYGLGLCAAAEAVRAHGGSIELANRTDDDGDIIGAAVVTRWREALAEGAKPR